MVCGRRISQSVDSTTDLQQNIKLMRLNGIIGLKYMRITHADPVSHSSTIDTQATWNSNDPLPDDGTANVVKVQCNKTPPRSLYLRLRSQQNRL